VKVSGFIRVIFEKSLRKIPSFRRKKEKKKEKTISVHVKDTPTYKTPNFPNPKNKTENMRLFRLKD